MDLNIRKMTNHPPTPDPNEPNLRRNPFATIGRGPLYDNKN